METAGLESKKNEWLIRHLLSFPRLSGARGIPKRQSEDARPFAAATRG
jgi:hypothetical protein